MSGSNFCKAVPDRLLEHVQHVMLINFMKCSHPDLQNRLSIHSTNVRFLAAKQKILHWDCRSKACDPSNRNFQIPAIRKCEQPQTQAVLEQLVSDGYEELLVFPPCELHSYLTGRTLWLIG
jgi:hypothetical protein